MKNFSEFKEIYLCTEFLDFRKQAQSLAVFVASELGKKPQEGALFVFMGRRRRRIKLLYWDRNGFALWYKTIATREKYSWTRFEEELRTFSLSAENLTWLLEGINIFGMKKHSAQTFEYFY